MVGWIKRFLWDESAFERYFRALVIGAAAAWNFYSIEGSMTRQGIIGSVMMGLAAMIGAGQKNPPPPTGP